MYIYVYKHFMNIMNMPLRIGSIPVHSAEALEEISGLFLFFQGLVG